MNFCTKCGNQIKPDARFCSKCGEITTQAIQPPKPQPASDSLCRSCGALMNPGAKFCIACGTPVTFIAPTPHISSPKTEDIPAKTQNIAGQAQVIQKSSKKKGHMFLKIAISILTSVCLSVAGLYFFGTFNPDTGMSRSVLYQEEKFDPVIIDSTAAVVEKVFAASDTAGLAKILSPSSLKQRRPYFPELLPHMRAFATDFKSRKRLYATARFAVYEFTSAEGRFTAEFCLGSDGSWKLMRF